MAETEEEVIEIDILQLKKMKVQELRKQAGELGLETKGTKAEILSRIEKYLKEQEEDLLEEEEEVEEGEAEEETPTTEEKEAEQPPKKATPPPADPQPAVAVVEKPAAVKKVTLGGTGALSAEESFAKRAERFGSNSSEEAKKIARAQRFGENGVGAQRVPTGEDMEKMKKRAERFGTSVAPSLSRAEDDEKKQKRKERFSLGTTDLSVEERKKARMERFGAGSK